MRSVHFLAIAAALAFATSSAFGQVYNLKIVTDASPDYSDLPSMVHSITSRWTTPEEKCWAMFYWNHKGRRQTNPMHLHGLEVTDPIRQFNDYGYTMCSTVAGVNCSIWHAMGMPVRYWDISNHTVSECFYGGRWHVYDNSMSAIYTLCDGRTIASVEDVGKEGACAASGGRKEPGHIARYHCLNATSPNGFLTGADCERSLEQEYRCFNPNALKHRYYFFDWDRGHRYILNLRPGESYGRRYAALGNDRRFFIPNESRDPEVTGYGEHRYRLRGTGTWRFQPELTAAVLPRVAESVTDLEAIRPAGLRPVKAGRPGHVVFKIDGANVITSVTIRASVERTSPADTASIAVSTTNGLRWKEVWRAAKTGEESADVELVEEVNGAYDALVRVTLEGKQGADGARLNSIGFDALTQHNSKTQPRLLLGKNTVYVGAGDQTGSIVLWPDLRGEGRKPYVVEEKNVACEKEHPGYMGVMHAQKAKEDAYVVFRIDAPHDITRINYGGRFYNRAPKSHIDLMHSFDGGKTWTTSYSLTEVKPPWDVIHYETVEGDKVPPGTKSVLLKYLWNSSEAGPSACSIYAVRMAANYKNPAAKPGPIQVRWSWKEVQPDRSLVERRHTEIVEKLPHTYTLNVGGVDHPVMDSLRIAWKPQGPELEVGYSDGRDVGGEKFVPRWVTYGTNVALGKPYTVSVPSGDNWGAGDPEGKKLTDGVIGPPYGAGPAARYGLCWTEGKEPVVTIDLGKPQQCGAFRIHLTGYPAWDAMKGEVKDEVEVLTSLDGKTYAAVGLFNLSLRWKDLPVNLMYPDDETCTAPIFELIPPRPVDVRYVQFKIKARRFTMVSEVQALDQIRYEPFDLRIALPK